MASEWAKEKVEKAYRKFDFAESWSDSKVAEALDAARIEGLEEAAKIVDDWPITGRCGISSAIRARIEEIKKA